VSETPASPIARLHLLTPLNPLWNSGLEDEGVSVHVPLGDNW